MRFVAVLIDGIGCVIAAIGLYGTLNLSWQVLVLSLMFEFFLACGFLGFIVLNYVGAVRADDKYAYVVLALYLPDVCFKFALTLAGIPFARSYYRLARADEDATSGSGAPTAAAPAAEAAPAALAAAAAVEEAAG